MSFDPKHKSRTISEGPDKTANRAMLRAMGLGDKDIAQPWVGVATVWSEATPCNVNLHEQGAKVADAIARHGATPRRFNTISVSDGIAMGHEGMRASLVSREVIADSVELMMRGHCYDALVGIAGCDKSLPGMLMAMARLDVPSVFLYGGTIMPGRFRRSNARLPRRDPNDAGRFCAWLTSKRRSAIAMRHAPCCSRSSPSSTERPRARRRTASGGC